MKDRLAAFALLYLSMAAWPSGGTAGELTYLVHEPAIASAHPPLIVLLHGAGADERDMIGLWQQLPGALVVVSPRGPFQDAGGGYRWYRKAQQEADIEVSRKIIDLFVDNAIKRFDADPTRVFVGGFSQGAVMSYEVALREPSRFRGAAVLSGVLFPAEQAHLSAKTDWSHESIFVGHGTADDRIPFSSVIGSRDALARLGVPTEFHAYPGMRHGVGDAETSDLSAWLAKRIATGSDTGPR